MTFNKLKNCLTNDCTKPAGFGPPGMVLATVSQKCIGAMRTRGNIEVYDSYQVPKKFRLHLKPVANYLVKRIGVDTGERRSFLGIRRGKRLPHDNRRAARMLHALRISSKKKKSKRIYHEPEPV